LDNAPNTPTPAPGGDSTTAAGDEVAADASDSTTDSPNGHDSTVADTEEIPIRVVDVVALANEVVRLTNIERVNAGLNALTQTPGLTRSAVVRSNEIVRSFSHIRPDGRNGFTVHIENGVVYTWAGENIAYGQTTPADVVRAWMASTRHKNMILNSEFNHIGVGVTVTDSGRLYWAQEFTD